MVGVWTALRFDTFAAAAAALSLLRMELLSRMVAGCISVAGPTTLSSSFYSSSCSRNGLLCSLFPEQAHLGSTGIAQRKQILKCTFARNSGSSENLERESSFCREHEQVSSSSASQFARRELVGKAVSLLLSVTALPALGAQEEKTEQSFSLYEDDGDKYSILVPQEWVKGEGSTKEKNKISQRKVTAFYPENDTSANVNIVITSLAADYQSLGSFGTADMFAESLVNSLDRAWQRPPGQKAILIDDSSRSEAREAQRHLFSVVGIANNGWYNRLYTVTAQYMEDEAEKYRPSIKKIVSSFKLKG